MKILFIAGCERIRRLMVFSMEMLAMAVLFSELAQTLAASTVRQKNDYSSCNRQILLPTILPSIARKQNNPPVLDPWA